MQQREDPLSSQLQASKTQSLVILNGPGAGRTHRLRVSETVAIGRHPDRQIPVDDDRVSRLHARVVHLENRWQVEDCGSLNGTQVNGRRVERKTLEPGDVIRIGDRLILFADDSASSDSSAGEESQGATAEYQRRESKAMELEPHLDRMMANVVRQSAVLSRLARALHERRRTDELIRCGIQALVDGLGEIDAAVWLVAENGRLRPVADYGLSPDDNLLASLAVEREQAVFHTSDEEATEPTLGGDTSPQLGTDLAVPIPGPQSCRGAIECHRSGFAVPFRRSDLEFVVIVAHQLGAALENCAHRERLEQANHELRRRLAEQTRLEGSSPAMQRVLDQVARVGPTSSNVLILGESGTGKELVAQSIHEMSDCSAGPYVTVNCAAFSESLLESELFGHEVGAFTGADRRYIGQFERAHRGTIFLDEVGEMSLACQAKLLRLLEGHPFQRLGGSDSIRVDVRVIAATHRDLLEMAAQKRFREDLYYRLRVIDIQMPPLRERGNDVIELATLFLKRFHTQMGRGPKRLSRRAVDVLRRYHWPGNIRELKNAVERAVVLGQHEEVLPEDLGLPLARPQAAPAPALVSLKEAERRHIQHVLEQVQGNKTQACRILGIGRGTLYNKLEEDDAGES